MECPICFMSFDHTKKVPRNISCGHTVCEECIKSLLERSILKCPLCRVAFEKKRAASSYPKSYALLDIVEKRLQERNTAFKFVCCKCVISECSDCAGRSKQDAKATKLKHLNKMVRLTSNVPVDSSYNLFLEIEKLKHVLSHNICMTLTRSTINKEAAASAAIDKEDALAKCSDYFDKILALITVKKKDSLATIEKEFSSYITELKDQIDQTDEEVRELKSLAAKVTKIEAEALDCDDPPASLEQASRELHSKVADVQCSVAMAVKKLASKERLDQPNIVFRSDLRNIFDSIHDKVEVYSLGKRYGDRYV